MKHKTIGKLCHEKAARPVPFFFTKKKQNKTKQNKTKNKQKHKKQQQKQRPKLENWLGRAREKNKTKQKKQKHKRRQNKTGIITAFEKCTHQDMSFLHCLVLGLMNR